MSNKSYITTAIPYVNAKPHIGFSLELVQADALARFARVSGRRIHFVTGTDENALKNVQAAEKAGADVKSFVNEHAQVFKNHAKALNISNDDFIRTTEERHIQGAQKLWDACKKRGDIYRKEYEGLYCVGCETFYNTKDLIEGLCPEHKIKPERISEDNYFFKLTNYQKTLEDLIKNNNLKIYPETRKNEVLAFIKQGLEDFSVSRSNERAKNWGVSVPGDDSQKMYVWFDALSNYITVVGYGTDDNKFQDLWANSRITHVIGKGISRFHAIYWPAILLSAGLKTPDEIAIHGYVTAEGEKISKSLGNAVDPFEVIDKFGVDPLRYYFLREIPSTGDGDFSIEKLKARYTSDLANNLGNLVSRVSKLIGTNLNKELIYNSKFIDEQVLVKISVTSKKYEQHIANFKLHEAVASLWEMYSFANVYINDHKPWEEAKTDQDKFLTTMTSITRLLVESTYLLEPFLPQTAEDMRSIFGVKERIIEWEGSKFIVAQTKILFPRLI